MSEKETKKAESDAIDKRISNNVGARNEDEREEKREPRDDEPNETKSRPDDDDKQAATVLDMDTDETRRGNFSTGRQDLAVTGHASLSVEEKKSVARTMASPSGAHHDDEARRSENTASIENLHKKGAIDGGTQKEGDIGVARGDSFPKYHEFCPSDEETSAIPPQSRPHQSTSNEMNPRPEDMSAAAELVISADKRGHSRDIFPARAPCKGDSASYSEDDRSTVRDCAESSSGDEAHCSDEEATTPEDLPDDSSTQVDSDFGRDTFLDYPQMPPGAVAVAGPDRDERDEQRSVTPKRILAERLQGAAARANAGITNDRVRPLGAAVRPGAVAVPGPDADDGRDEDRVVTPKRMLAERLQQAAEREETTATEHDADEMEQREELRHDSVTLQDYGVVEAGSTFPKDWPSGLKLEEILQQQGIDVTKIGDDSTFWQASARWALLRKYGHLPNSLQDPYIQSDNGVSRLRFSEDDIQMIQTTWRNLQEKSSSNSSDDLEEFMSTSKSCGRQLQWTAMDCAPATQFKLHAHPNMELIYCARGALHEIRMSGAPFSRDFGPTGEVEGPNLTKLDRSWYFATVNQGEWLVNEVGSIHKSFTATNGDGCLLLVLWGGSHADVKLDQQPTEVNVQQAVDKMDDKLSTCDCNKGDKLSETFLPESERIPRLE